MYSLHHANVLEWAATYDGEPFHALITDPPYHLTSITERFGKQGSAPAQFGKDGAFQRASRGFMNAQWDGGSVAFEPETWYALAQHLHPGAFGMAFASTRGLHRMMVAIEDAGLIIHPVIFCWGFGSGFPKATRIDTTVDRMAGASRAVVGQKAQTGAKFKLTQELIDNGGFNDPSRAEYDITAPATPLAAAWAGHRYGLQSLKPAFEPLVTFHKPLNENRFCAIISQISVLMEGLTCTLLPACDAEPITNRLHQTLKVAVDNFVRGNAGTWVSLERVKIAGDHSASSLANLTLRNFVAGPAPTPDAMRQLVKTIIIGAAGDLTAKDTSWLNEAVNILGNIALLWNKCLDVLSNPGNTFTTATEENLIIDLKILRSLIEMSIHAATMPPSNQHGLLSYVHTVAMSLQNLIVKLPLLNGITATEGATDRHANLDNDRGGAGENTNPIIVFQKPYQGKPVECITTTGAGALNIEMGRIGWDAKSLEMDTRRRQSPGMDITNNRYIGGENAAYTKMPDSPAGRWPANLILSHTPRCDDGGCADDCPVKRIGEQSGETRSAYVNAESAQRNAGKAVNPGMFGGDISGLSYADEGTAARFFYNADWAYERLEEADPVVYVPKASTAEREAGLHDFAPTTVNDGRDTPIDNPYQRGETQRRNVHPTIKPISLIKHLATLLLPPAEYAPRRILVPFSGAGSEMIACHLAGWESITGIELEAAHVDIARHRLEWWTAAARGTLATEPDAILDKAGDKTAAQLAEQLTLFDIAA